MAIGNRVASYLRFILKLVITGLALYFVFQKIDVSLFLKEIRRANIWWLLFALALFNLSKIVAAFRLLLYYRKTGIRLDARTNLKLYYLGMFYNLFLPGAIGGDAYKVYWLKQQSGSQPTRQLISATLLDRLSGLAALLFLALLGCLFTTLVSGLEYWLKIIIVGCLVLLLPLWKVIHRFIFRVYDQVFYPTTLLSFFVQLLQVVASICILFAIQAEGNIIDYLTLFLASSVVAVLPFTIGGVGARELVFLYGYQYLNIQQEPAIAFTILFFIITAVSSLIGLYYAVTLKVNK